MNKTVIAVVAVVVIVGGYFLFVNRDDTNNNNNSVTPPPPASSNNNTNSNTNTGSEPQSGEVTINYTTSGYSPSTVNIKKGTKVTYVNQTSGVMWPASAPHPTHTDYPEFDPKQAIAAGQSWSFTFDKTGTWRFHDHQNPSKFGSVVVTE
jgi:plastocyanin